MQTLQGAPSARGGERTEPGRGGGKPSRGGGHRQSGRGLLIVRALASRRGREENEAGRTVWFEIDW